MAISHEVVTLSDSVNTIVTVSGIEAGISLTISIQNIDATAIVYVGDSTVSSTSYGIKLNPGQAVSFDSLPKKDEIYAISSVNESKVAVIRLAR